MEHEYTDAEIGGALPFDYVTLDRAKDIRNARAFLSALPMKSAEPERPQPWPSQQEAIDKAFEEVKAAHLVTPKTGDDYAPARLAIAQAYDAARPQAAEIAELKAERDRLAERVAVIQERNVDMENQCDKLDASLMEVVKAAERAGWNGVENSKHLPTFITTLAEDLSKAQAALRQSTQSAQPILSDDGRSLGQVAFEAAGWTHEWESSTIKDKWQKSARAVAAVVEARMIRRMEAVPVKEIARSYETAAQFHASECGLEAVRSRLIAAYKGEGQAHPVGVNEPPKSEGQPDLSGESEKQTEPAWIPHDGGPCPLKDEEVEEWEDKRKEGGENVWQFPPSRAAGWSFEGRNPITHYRVLKWKPGFGPEAKAEPAQPWTPENAKAYEDFQAELRETWEAKPTTSPGWTPAVGDVVCSIPEMALGGQMYWRDLALQIARVWWKCHNIGASLQHGDLDKDIAFSIVCERHGGRVFHGDTPENAWHKAEEWLLSPDRENFPAACLTPSRP